MVYFPDEVFRNIASFLVDPYKADREKHASVWQTIRVKRERYTIRFLDSMYDDRDEDEYFVYQNTGKIDAQYASISTMFFEDDHTAELENMHQYLEWYDDDDSYGEDPFDTDDHWHNYAHEQYD
jgi:hypothetical protein